MTTNRFERPITPAEISSGLQVLIEQLVSGGIPIHVDVRPMEGALADECFPLVKRAVAEWGGEAVVGWSLWELPSLFVEAEFHCVWRQPNGELLDIAPKKYPTARVLFLPDAFRNYEDRQVNNIRQAIRPDATLVAYLGTFDAEFELVNRGERASQHGQMELQGKDAEEYYGIQQQRAYLHRQLSQLFPVISAYHPCPCGSGKKVKWCHRQLAKP